MKPQENDITVVNIAKIIQSMAISVGVIVGGIWTYYEFMNDNARELRKITTQQISQELKKGAVIDISINEEQTIYIDGSTDLIVTATIKNTGNSPALMSFGKRAPFSIYLCTFDKNKTISMKLTSRGFSLYEDVRYERIATMPNLIIYPGGSKTLHSAFMVDLPGLYLISFSVPFKDSNDSESGEINIGHWSNAKYVYVGDH